MKHLGTRRLETARLILRPFTMEDALAMYRNWASDPEVTKYLTWPAHESIDLTQGSAIDLSRYEDDFFDAVLIFGPLYHLHSPQDRRTCIREAMRVCKTGGKLFFAFISNDMVILTEFSRRPDYFAAGDYDKETFRLENFPFVFHTVQDCRELLRESGVHVLHAVASDGVSELLEDRINALNDGDYEQYLRYHSYICEKPEFLGMSNHLLFVGEKQL